MFDAPEDVCRILEANDIDVEDEQIIITRQLTTYMSIEDKILKIHDYIINNTRYDVNKTSDNSFNADVILS